MILTDDAILSAFKWSKPEEKSTKRGARILRRAKDTPEAVKFWNENKPALAAAGVTFGLKWKTETNEKEFCWWQVVPDSVIQERAKNEELSRATDADIAVPIPPGKALLGYQKAGVAFINGKEGALLGDEMGLGKTVQAVCVINIIPTVHKILVICPSKLKINWYRELRAWLTKPLSIGIANSKSFPTTDIVIINYDILHKFTARLEIFWDLVIIDEAHMIKSPKARRTQIIVGYKPKRDEDPSIAKSGIPAKRKLAMSGTPMLNRREELFTLCSWLAPQIFNNWWKFCRVMSEADIQKQLRSSIMIRRLKKDVLTELPPKRRQILPLPNELETRQLVMQENDMMRQHTTEFEARIVELEAAVELAKAQDEDTYAAAVAALRKGVTPMFDQIAKVRYETGMAKLPMVKQELEDMLEQNEKIVVGAYHRDVIDELHRAFQGVGCLKIYGGMTTQESQRNVDLFQNDPNYKLIILQFDIAVGMTLTAASVGVAAELHFVPGIMSQWEDRMHRIGQRDSVNIYHLVLEGSYDMRMAEIIVDKQNLIDATLDDIHPPSEAEKLQAVTPWSNTKVKTSRSMIDSKAKQMTPQLCEHIHVALKSVAARCNHATSWDSAGFSKIDSRIGHDLAGMFFLTPRQAVIGQRLVNKYRRQLDEGLVEACKAAE